MDEWRVSGAEGFRYKKLSSSYSLSTTNVCRFLWQLVLITFIPTIQNAANDIYQTALKFLANYKYECGLLWHSV